MVGRPTNNPCRPPSLWSMLLILNALPRPSSSSWSGSISEGALALSRCWEASSSCMRRENRKVGSGSGDCSIGCWSSNCGSVDLPSLPSPPPLAILLPPSGTDAPTNNSSQLFRKPNKRTLTKWLKQERERGGEGHHLWTCAPVACRLLDRRMPFCST